jgi:hypothetical protein
MVVDLLPSTAIDVVCLRPALAVESHARALCFFRQGQPHRLHLLDELF